MLGKKLTVVRARQSRLRLHQPAADGDRRRQLQQPASRTRAHEVMPEIDFVAARRIDGRGGRARSASIAELEAHCKSREGERPDHGDRHRHRPADHHRSRRALVGRGGAGGQPAEVNAARKIRGRPPAPARLRLRIGCTAADEAGRPMTARWRNLNVRLSRLRPNPGTHGLVQRRHAGKRRLDLCRLRPHRLEPGETAGGRTGEREVCLVFVSGKGQVTAGGKDFGELGERMSPVRRRARARSMCRPAADWSVDGDDARSNSPSARRRAAGLMPPELIPPDIAPADRPRQGHQHPLRHQHPAGGREPARLAAGGRGDHARRQHVVLSAAQARPGRPAATKRYSRRPTTTASTRRRASPSSASIPTTARSTRRWWSRTATWRWCRRGYHPVAACMATTSITSTSWPGRSARGSSTMRPSTEWMLSTE